MTLSITTLSITTLSIMTLSMTTLSIMILSIMTLIIMTLSIMTLFIARIKRDKIELVHTSQYKEVNCTEPSPLLRVPCFFMLVYYLLVRQVTASRC